jgi:hypothetical protein
MSGSESVERDLELIEHSLRRWRSYAQDHRFGGLGTDWVEACDACEALARVRAWLKRPQLKLFDLGGDDGA